MLARLIVVLQYLLPRYWITAIVYRLARISHVAFKDYLIARFVQLYDVDTSDVMLNVPEGFGTFNEFFVRELEPGARPIDDAVNGIVSPVDGTVSQAGSLQKDLLLQAKGREYTLDDLLATDLDEARAFVDGAFATIYLAPYNYHRVHAPVDGELVAARFVPGDLFSVNTATAAVIPGLFRRNERLVMHFKTACGPAALVFVGAMNVGSITTPWTGEIRPRKYGVVDAIDLSNASCTVRKGDLLGWFNMGSTVIVLMPRQVCTWRDDMQSGKTLRMGELIGSLREPAT